MIGEKKLDFWNFPYFQGGPTTFKNQPRGHDFEHLLGFCHLLSFAPLSYASYALFLCNLMIEATKGVKASTLVFHCDVTCVLTNIWKPKPKSSLDAPYFSLIFSRKLHDILLFFCCSWLYSVNDIYQSNAGNRRLHGAFVWRHKFVCHPC